MQKFTLVCRLFLLAIIANIPHSQANNYAGDTACQKCHEGIYQDYKKSGHPYKIQKINGKAPSYPAGTSAGVPHPPKGMVWSDISYVIGGYGWKARFMDHQGYILTGKTNRQYNLANPDINTETGWTGYSAKTAPKKPYTCGSCHTTGWQATGPQGPHQDNLPGIHGTWAQPGVTCEACHGPSANHVKDPETSLPSIDENCSDCHKRGDIRKIDVSKGLIRHHEQAETLRASGHKSLDCVTCHNPHKSTKYKMGGFLGTQKTCLMCHNEQKVKLKSAAHQTDCISCHMPRVAKSAVSVKHKTASADIPEGDLRSHIFAITTDPDWKLLDDKGKFVRQNKQRRAYITVDHSCLSCHTDKSLEWALEQAKKVH